MRARKVVAGLALSAAVLSCVACAPAGAGAPTPNSLATESPRASPSAASSVGPRPVPAKPCVGIWECEPHEDCVDESSCVSRCPRGRAWVPSTRTCARPCSEVPEAPVPCPEGTFCVLRDNVSGGCIPKR